jgi:hypothetical protein
MGEVRLADDNGPHHRAGTAVFTTIPAKLTRTPSRTATIIAGAAIWATLLKEIRVHREKVGLHTALPWALYKSAMHVCRL